MSSSNLHENAAHLWTLQITLNLITMLHIIKCLYYCFLLSFSINFFFPRYFDIVFQSQLFPYLKTLVHVISLIMIFPSLTAMTLLSWSWFFLLLHFWAISFILLLSFPFFPFCFASRLLICHLFSFVWFSFFFISLLIPFYFLHFSCFYTHFLSVICLYTPVLTAKNWI